MPAEEPPCRRRLPCKTHDPLYVEAPTESDATVPDMAAQASSSRDLMFYCVFLKTCWVQLMFVDKRKTMEIRSWKCNHQGRVFVVESRSGRHVVGHFTVQKIVTINHVRTLTSYRQMHQLSADTMNQMVYPVYGWILSDIVMLPEPIWVDIQRNIVRATRVASAELAALYTPDAHGSPATTDSGDVPLVDAPLPPLLPPQPPVPEPEPASAAAPSDARKEGNRNVAKTIAVKFVILQQFKELAAAGKNANIEMLKLKVKEYYAGVPPVHDLDDCLASFSSIASGRLESHDVGCHG